MKNLLFAIFVIAFSFTQAQKQNNPHTNLVMTTFNGKTPKSNTLLGSFSNENPAGITYNPSGIFINSGVYMSNSEEYSKTSNSPLSTGGNFSLKNKFFFSVEANKIEIKKKFLADGFSNNNVTYNNHKQLENFSSDNLNIAFAYKFSPKLSAGFSTQFLENELIETNRSQGALVDKNSQAQYIIPTIGATYQINDKIRLGIQHQFQSLQNKFESEWTAFSEKIPYKNAFQFAYFYKKNAVEFDIEHINTSDLGYDLKDTYSIGIGYNRKQSDNFSFMAGAKLNTNPYEKLNPNFSISTGVNYTFWDNLFVAPSINFIYNQSYFYLFTYDSLPLTFQKKQEFKDWNFNLSIGYRFNKKSL